MTEENTHVDDRAVDRTAITDLLVAYAWALDGREWDLLGEVFTDPVALDYPVGFRSGPLARCIDDFRVFHEVFDGTYHVMTNQHVTIDGDAALMRAYAQGTLVKHGHPGGDNFAAGTYYTDSVVRVNGRWRIAERRMHVVWTTGNLELVNIGRRALAAASA